MTAPARRTTERARLIEAVAKLERIEQPSLAHRLALSEAHFRLAVQPDTDAAEALDHIRAAIALDAVHPKLHFHYGRLLHRTGDCQGALVAYRQALRLAPASHRTAAHLALALCELGEPEKKAGRELLDALFRAHSMREPLAQVDEIIKRLTADPDAKPEEGGPPPRRAKAGPAKPPEPGEPCRWPRLWRLALAEQSSRLKPVPKQVDERLAKGAANVDGPAGVNAYALACLDLLFAGEPPETVAALRNSPPLKDHADEPAVRMIDSALTLSRMTEPSAFVAAAAEALNAKELPAEVVWWLHFSKFGPESPLGAREAFEAIESYPPGQRGLESFTEFRLAMLDGYARRAWADGDFPRARLLWREAAALDPFRIATAHNLALVAARTRALDEYESAWTLAAEVRYLYAAALGDLQAGLDERRALHLALAQQSRQRYEPAAQAGKEERQRRMLAWTADKGALETYLREWDLYYLNSRLRFRSPVHRLGIAADASPEVAAAARDALIRLVAASVETLPWTGIGAFAALARKSIEDAHAEAADPVLRKRDSYIEIETAESDALTQECIDRALTLNGLLNNLTAQPGIGTLRTGLTIGRSLFALPWVILEPACERRGLTGEDKSILHILEENFLGVIASDRTEPRSAADVTERLAVMEEYFALVPGRSKEIGVVRHNHSALIDAAAVSRLPQHLLRPQSVTEAERTVSEGRKALVEFPQAAGLRKMLVDLLLQLGSGAHVKQAAELIEEGIEMSLTEDQREEFRRLQPKAQEKLQNAAVLDRIKALLEPAQRRVQDAIEDLNRHQSREAVDAVLAAAAAAIESANEAARMARKAGLADAEGQARSLADQCREIRRKLGGR